MSKIGRRPIAIPKGVKVVVSGNVVKVEGPKGKLSHVIAPEITVEVANDTINVKRANDKKQTVAFHGMMRSKLNSMALGAGQGFTKELELVGVGFRADLQGKVLNFTLGYSHPIKFKLPDGVTAAVDKQTRIILTSADKELLGQTAANIIAFRYPDIYKGKGIRFAGQQIKLKPGKAAAAKK